MTEYLNTVLRVARWEFIRYFKIKDVIFTFAIFAVSGLVGFFVTKMNLGNEPSDVNIAVINQSNYEFLADSTSKVNLSFFDIEQKLDLKEKVKLREFDALLEVDSAGVAKLLVYKLPQWKGQLAEVLQNSRLKHNLNAINLSREEYDSLNDKYEIEVVYHEESDRKSGKTELIVAAVLMGIMIVGILTGIGVLFAGITGEKASKITEQVVAAISPQAWIDGKILGSSLVVFAYVGSMILLALLIAGMAGMAGLIAFIPFDVIRVGALFQFVVISFLGFYFWFTFFAALSATINDPNTSSKGSLMMLPLGGIIFSFMAFDNPDSMLMKILGYIPIFTPTVFPTRIIIGETTILEFLLICLIMILSTWMMRKAAGKIFAIGIMIQGKEPNMAEIFKWLKKT